MGGISEAACTLADDWAALSACFALVGLHVAIAARIASRSNVFPCAWHAEFNCNRSYWGRVNRGITARWCFAILAHSAIVCAGARIWCRCYSARYGWP